MNQWSRRRKRIILSAIILVLVFLVALPLFFLFYRAPTCQDQRQNGSETGVDCGGSCQLLCSSQSLPLILKGDPRILVVGDGTFEVLALVENPNASGEIYRAGYTFKLYDASSSVPVKILSGESYVPKGVTFAIFEGPFALPAGTIPRFATLEWQMETLLWRASDGVSPKLVAREIRFSREETNPRLDALIDNLSLDDVSNVDLVAIVSNVNGSVFAASKTYVDKLPAGGHAAVVFTWPKAFVETPLKTNILIRVFPDKSFLK